MIDRLVVARGAATALLIAMPAALANVFLAAAEDRPEGLLVLTFLALIVAFLVGGVLAGAEARERAAQHGALAAVVAFVPVQVIGILGRLDRGDPIRPVGIVILGLLAACAGTAGARLGATRRARRETT